MTSGEYVQTTTQGVRTPIGLGQGELRRTLRLCFLQAMVGAIYGASTGGMFLIGYALKLGATDAQIGLMSTIPMLCVGVQLLTAALVERGVSRRKLTFAMALLNASGWALVILIPFAPIPKAARVYALIGVITLVTGFGFVAGNARGSWVGDLIPARFRGRFFGRLALYGGVVAMGFALLEGVFLDHVKALGLGAFSLLFGFGMLFGLGNALLFWPQPDVPLAQHSAARNLGKMVWEALRNRRLMIVAGFAVLWSLQSIAGPFYPTYMLRDLGMPFVGVGLVNACVMVALLASGPFWGRVVDRWGCRPVLVACAAGFAPLQLCWIWIDSPSRAYAILPVVNLVAGFVVGGVGVALNTLVYKVTPAQGRSVQLAVYSILVLAVAAPFPALGGHLPDWLGHLGLHGDLRVTFYTAGAFVLIAAWAARGIDEPGSSRTGPMLRGLGMQWLSPMVKWWG